MKLVAVSSETVQKLMQDSSAIGTGTSIQE